MIPYQFSKREKALLALLVVILVGLAWYMFVFRYTSAETTRLDSEIESAQTLILADTARVASMDQMQSDIDARKAEGAIPTEMPDYDNLQPLMAELNTIMSMADSYSLSFDKVEDPEDGYVKRGADISFECASYASAESLVDALANAKYPCMVESVRISDSSYRSTSRAGAKATAAVYVTFLEKA